MKLGLYELASLAGAALRRAQQNGRKVEALSKRDATPTERARVVSAQCEICGKVHRMGLGAPRCTTPVKVQPLTPDAARSLCTPFAMVVLVACLTLSGCSHFYVSGVTLGAGTTSDGKEITAGLSFAPLPFAPK